MCTYPHDSSSYISLCLCETVEYTPVCLQEGWCDCVCAGDVEIHAKLYGCRDMYLCDGSICESKGLRCGAQPDPGASLHLSCLFLVSIATSSSVPSRKTEGEDPDCSGPQLPRIPLGSGDNGGEGTDGRPLHPPQAICYGPHPGDLRAWQGRGRVGWSRGRAPQLPQLPPPKPPLSLILCLGDIGRILEDKEFRENTEY